MEGTVAYHTVNVEVSGVSPFTDIDFLFPAHHKRVVGVTVEPSLIHSDYTQGQTIGRLTFEFMGQSVNYDKPIRAFYPSKSNYDWSFAPLDVELTPNQFTNGHYHNLVNDESSPGNWIRYTLAITFKVITDDSNK